MLVTCKSFFANAYVFLFWLPRRNCAALHELNQLGPEGYHWRVCVEEKKSFSWWDIQDENAILPVKEASQSELRKFFKPKSSESSDTASAVAKEATRAFKGFGKAVTSAVAGGADDLDSGPPVAVIAFKLLDLVKVHNDHNLKHQGPSAGHGQSSAPRQSRTPRPPAPAPGRSPRQNTGAPVPPQSYTQQRRVQSTPQHGRRPQQQPQHPPRRQPAPEASLMDFGSSPPSTSSSSNTSNLTRAEKLKRDYAKKKQNSNRVWDDVDQRWVEVDPKAGGKVHSTASAPPGANSAPKKNNVKGISLDPSNAVGKSQNVQAQVNKRVNDMKEAQAKALQEIREREAKKKSDENAEDSVRRKLEPKIKQWSEEHGKKKQLRALLGSLHTILWPGANWKPVSIGDILDDSKCKRCYHKASRVVHPDKTHHLDAEQRFLAKRIFDALSQAKTDFDNKSG